MYALESSPDLEFAGFIRYPHISVEHGSFAFVTGPSGCGKSSYLRLVNGTAIPSAGSVCLDGQDAASLSPLERRRRALLVPQETYLLDETVEDNFAFYYESRSQQRPNAAAMRAALDMCCADDIAINAHCGDLSGGERQRVFQAIFLSFPDWKLLLLDEPTTSLDEATEARFFSNVRATCAERCATALAVSHSEAATHKFATQVIALSPPERNGTGKLAGAASDNQTGLTDTGLATRAGRAASPNGKADPKREKSKR